MRVTSFPPIAQADAKVLILGTMPGRRSLEMNEYYATPQNIFWHQMGELCAAGPDLPYAQRIARLKEEGIALWDVFMHCEREGSLDTRIADGTAVPNNLKGFLESQPAIQAVFFNGAKAEKVFRLRIAPLCSGALLSKLSLITLPSTSPANTRISTQEKRTQWNAIRRFL